MGNQQGGENMVNFTQEELERLLLSFKHIDDNHNGEIDLDEFQKVNIYKQVEALKMNPLVKRVFEILDTDNSNSISFKEFIQGIGQLYGDNEEQKLKFAFKVYDMDEDGYISNGELFTVLKMMVGDNLKEVQLQQLVDRTIIKADTDFDGKISFDEFKNMVKDLDVANKLKIQQI